MRINTTAATPQLQRSGQQIMVLSLNYLNISEHVDALPDLGSEALEHIRVLRDQPLQLVLHKRGADGIR